MILQTFKPSELRCKKRLCPALLVIDTFFYQKHQLIKYPPSINEFIMNYWYCIICRISNYSKLPTANFFPFFHKKRSKYDVFRTYWKILCFFLFCFVFWKMSQRQESSVILWKCVLVRDYVGNTFYNFLPIHWTDLFYFRLVVAIFIVEIWAI